MNGAKERFYSESGQKIVNRLLEQKTAEITQGLPGRNKDEWWRIFYLLLHEQNLSRIPIIGTGGKVYMLINPELSQHTALWEKLGSPKQVDFTTSIEGMTFRNPSSPAIVLLDVVVSPDNLQVRTVYQPLGSGTDMSAIEPGHPVAKEFTREGRGVMKNIVLKLPGASFL